MEHVEEIQSAAHAAAARASEMVVEFSEHLRAHPAVQSAIEHPIFQHEIFQHPVLQQLLNDPRALAILTGIIVILVVFACYPTGGRTTTTRRSGTPTALFVGPPDSGKTALFAKDERPFTHTSLVPSISTVALPSDDEKPKVVRLVDLAGHARLRDQVGQHVETADGVVFVVDVVALVRNAAAAAEELPPLLTQLAGSASRRGLSAPPPRLLILANKTDLLARSTAGETPSPPELSQQARSTALERVKSILTREMDRLKSARGAGGVGGRIEGMSRVSSSGGGFWARLFGSGASKEPEATTEDDEALVWGGAGAFRWEDVEGVEVSWGVSGVGAASTTTTEATSERGNGLDELTYFLWDL